ncbi:MAG: hypothetical protein C0402_05640 [Thermodesulfovibrio sp.]|nr:hypothetical protein [Thermodesulfovibrio sp.]
MHLKKPGFYLICFLMVGFFASRHVSAATYTVTHTGDSGVGSLRQAIIQANGSAGTDTIAFAVGNGHQTIQPASALPTITDPVTIDGTTQPGFAGTPIIELDGTNVVGTGVYDGLNITAGNTTVRGLVINRFSGGGISLTGGNYITVVGNYVGVDVTGTVAQPNDFGINLQGPNYNTIMQNIISGNSNYGLRLSGSSDSIIKGNYIGVTVNGSSALGNGNQGLRMDNSWRNIVGGTGGGEGNIISNNGDAGIRLGFASDSQIQGNIIAANNGGGVHVYSGINNAILSNSIYSNGKLGIDLDVDGWLPADGVTPNDQGDPDGPDAVSNHLQNFPVLAAATLFGLTTTVVGSLNSTAGSNYTVEFFSNAACDPAGYGEGEILIGSTVVATNANGDATMNVPLPVLAAGSYITSTATDAAGNTSEFSACIQRLNIDLAGDGLGTVTGNPGNINCGADCSVFLPPSTVVAFTGVPDSSSYFGGWTGDPDCADGKVTIDSVKTCTATFMSCAGIDPARINGTTTYGSLDAAYQAASLSPNITSTIDLIGSTMSLLSGYDFIDDKRVILQGGLNCTYEPVAGAFTQFTGGPFIISNGTVTFDRILLM